MLRPSTPRKTVPNAIEWEERLGFHSSLQDIWMQFSIANADLGGFCVNLKDDRVSFSGNGFRSTFENTATLPLKLG
jgi:hypothetical protein